MIIQYKVFGFFIEKLYEIIFDVKEQVLHIYKMGIHQPSKRI